MTTFAEQTRAFREQQVAQTKANFIAAAAEYATLLDNNTTTYWGAAYSMLQSAEQALGALANKKATCKNFMETPHFQTFYDQTGPAWYNQSKDSFIIQINDKFYRARIGKKFEELCDQGKVGERLQHVCDFIRDNNQVNIVEEFDITEDFVPQVVWGTNEYKERVITIRFTIEGASYELYRGDAIQISK
jgi:hypothetical protein